MYTLPYSAVSAGDSGSSKRKKYTLMFIEVLVNVHPPVECWISTWLGVISKKEWFFMLLRFGDYINWLYKQWFIISHLLNRTVLSLVKIIGLQPSASFPVNLDNASFVWFSVPVEYQCCLAKEAVSPLLYKKILFTLYSKY